MFPKNLIRALFENAYGERWLDVTESDEVHVPADFKATLHYIYETRLTDRERNCMIQYYEQERTLEEVADSYKVTRERIRQVIRKSLRKLGSDGQTREMIKLGMAEWMRKVKKSEVRAAEKAAFEQGILFERCRMVEVKNPDSGEAYRDAMTDLENKMSKTIDEMDLTVRSYNCLRRANVRTVKDLMQMNVTGLKKVRNLGRRSIDEILGRLQELSLIADVDMAYENEDEPLMKIRIGEGEGESK